MVSDHQPSQVQAVASMDDDLLIRNVLSVAPIAMTYGLPIVPSTVNVANGQSPPIPELRDVPSGAVEIDRTQINSREHVELRHAHEATGRKKLIMTPRWTEVCLTFPALEAMREGYEVFPGGQVSKTCFIERPEVACPRVARRPATTLEPPSRLSRHRCDRTPDGERSRGVLDTPTSTCEPSAVSFATLPRPSAELGRLATKPRDWRSATRRVIRLGDNAVAFARSAIRNSRLGASDRLISVMYSFEVSPVDRRMSVSKRRGREMMMRISARQSSSSAGVRGPTFAMARALTCFRKHAAYLLMRAECPRTAGTDLGRASRRAG
jgi:hypothetical protein